MKTILKRIGALALTGAMCVSLFGCGDKKEDSQDQHKLLSDELGYGYLAEYQDLDLGLEFLESTSMAGGKVYLQGHYYDEENIENSGERIYELDPATGDTKLVEMAKLESGENSSENVQAMTLSPDGTGYWLVTNIYTYTPMEDEELGGLAGEEVLPDAKEDPEAVPADGAAPSEEAAAGEEAPADAEAPAEDDAGLSGGVTLNLLTNAAPAADVAVDAEIPAAEPESSAEEDLAAEPMPIESDSQDRFMAKKFDMSGRLLQEIDLTEAVSEMEWFYCQAVAQDGEGNLYIAADQGKVLCFDKSNQRRDDIQLDTTYVQSMVTAGNGAVLAAYYEAEGGGGTVLSRLEDGAVSDTLRPEGISETGSLYIYGGDGDTVLLSDGNLLYYLNVTNGETTKLLSWLDSDINSSNISGVAGSEEELLVLLTNYAHTSGEYTFELGRLKKTPAEELPERTVLTLGAEYLDMNVRAAVVEFNRTNTQYRISLVDYSTYNTPEDYTLGAKQLELDVVSGNSPDLISLSGSKVDKYIGKGALANLTELLEKDADISEEDLIAGPLKGFSKDGKLYGMPYSFGVQTLYGSAKLLGERESWTTKEMAEVLEGLPEDVEIMNFGSQTSFLSLMLYNNLTSFVDYNKATCAFDSEEFKSLLRAAAHLPADTEEDNMMVDDETVAVEEYVDDRQQVQQGDMLLTNGYVYDANAIKEFMNLYIPKNGFVQIGYPSDSGNGVVLSVNGGLAIADKCKDKDGAWAFIKSILSDDFQKEQWEMPVTVSAFDAMMKETQEQSYYMAQGEKIYQESTSYIGDTEYKIGELTDEQVQEFKDIVNNAARVMTTYDSDLMEIISEESAPFFAGDKTVDEVADLIQNKASIYLGETS